MPDKAINYDNLTRFKSDLDPLLAEKAEAADVYSKSAFDAQLAGKQAKLTPEQIADIDAVPGKQDAMEPISNDFVDALFGYLQVDPILANNSWATIATVCEAGMANNYWSLGDTKEDTGTDSVTRTMRICDMYNAYPGRVVFEEVELYQYLVSWVSSIYHVDDDNCYNNYEISAIRRNCQLQLEVYSANLQSAITATDYKVAKNGKSSMVLELTDKLFLPAEKEIFGSSVLSRASEANELAWFGLYAANNTNSFRIKERNNTPNTWWLRSPRNNSGGDVCLVGSDGSAGPSGADGSFGRSVCFTF